MSSLLYEEHRDDVLIVHFNEQSIMDQAKLNQVEKELAAAIDNVEAGKMLINFDNVTYLSSSLIGQLFAMTEECKKRDVKLKLCAIDDQIMQVFKLMHLHKKLDIYASEDKALAAFKKKGWFG